MDTLEFDDDTVLRWAPPDSLADREAEAIALLSVDERTRFATTVSEHARSRLLWGRLLLRELVAERSGVSAAEVTIMALCPDCGGAHGRPITTGPNDASRALSVSVSGCAGMVVVATSHGRRIGIDIEPATGSTDRLLAIQRIAGETEDPLRHWTRVEAVLKADGRGLRMDPQLVEVDGDLAELDGVQYRLIEPDIDPRFVVSVALASAPRSGRVAERE